MMKLQVNNTGSWKHVVTLAPEHLQAAKDAAENIGLVGEAAGKPISWRVLDDSESVTDHWVWPGGWVSARRAYAQGKAVAEKVGDKG